VQCLPNLSKSTKLVSTAEVGGGVGVKTDGQKVMIQWSLASYLTLWNLV
jgi:hypothetical protein